MASKIDICNHALLLLGQPAIMSIDDNSTRARVCSQEYEMALEATLRSHPWPFAVKRAILPRLEEKPEFDYGYFYQLPEDCVRVISIRVSSMRGVNGEFFDNALALPAYQVEEHKVATNADAVYVRYVSKVGAEALDTATMSVVAYRLASTLAVVLLENVELKQMLLSEHARLIQEARNVSSVEDAPQIPTEGPWIPRR